MTPVPLKTTELNPFTTQHYHLVSDRVRISPLHSLTFLSWFVNTELGRDTQMLQLSHIMCWEHCTLPQTCFYGGLACVLSPGWECFCFVKLTHTLGPCPAV